MGTRPTQYRQAEPTAPEPPPIRGIGRGPDRDDYGDDYRRRRKKRSLLEDLFDFD